MPKPAMTIIGYGPMGKRFTDLFSEDYYVIVSSSRNVEEEIITSGAVVTNDRPMSISKSDYIFLAVPLNALSLLIEEINTHKKNDAIVIDCCSARVPAEKTLAHLKCQHFGMHDVKSGEYCITGKIDAGMQEFFNKKNISINILSPEEHDRLNAVVGIGHFIGLSIGKFLTKEEKEILSGTGSGLKLMSLVNHLERNTPTTWHETQMDNEFTKYMRESFIKAVGDYHKLLSEGEYPF